MPRSAVDAARGGAGPEAVRGGEIVLWMSSPGDAFDRHKQAWEKSRPERIASLRANIQNDAIANYQAKLRELGASGRFTDKMTEAIARANEGKALGRRSPGDFTEAAQKSWRSALGDAEDDLSAQVDTIRTAISNAVDSAQEAVNNDPKDVREANEKAFKHDRRIAHEALARMRVDYADAMTQIRGYRIGEAFVAYQHQCVQNILRAAWRGRIADGMQYYPQIVARDIRPATPRQPALDLVPPFDLNEGTGVLFWVLMSVQGFFWLICEHWLFAAIFLLAALAVWALFGGAVYRIAALQAAREEKISMAQALRFSAGKFLGFFTAPLIPLAVVGLLGALLVIGGAVGNIPGFGPVFIGVMSFLAIILGLVMAFILVGLVGGLPLMYPTIAVEGSDSFDAISRSYAYAFERPWRLIFYSIVALVYGSLCWLFVRLFAYVALAVSQWFSQLLLWGGEAVGGDSKLDAMWTPPTFYDLHGPFNWLAMSWGEKIGAAFIWAFTGIVAVMVFAFLLTFAASASTMIYYLLRRRIDATDMDDVFVEESLEPAPAAPAPPPPPDAAPPPAPAPAPENPPTA
jgi:hypothetical protein